MIRIFYRRYNTPIDTIGVLYYKLNYVNISIPYGYLLQNISTCRKFLFIIGSNCFYAYIDTYSVNPKNGDITNISVLFITNKKYSYSIPIRYSKLSTSLIFKKSKKTIYIIRRYFSFSLNCTYNIPTYIYINLSNLKYRLLVSVLLKVFSRFLYIDRVPIYDTFFTF
ncbi:hypothetical protein [Candidatus Vidania fulgoroideorum]